jgi:hypothetical protein
MLETLDAIDWDRFRSSTSTSRVTVPAALRALASCDVDMREDLERQVLLSVLPTYPGAVPEIIPFLFELLRSEEVQGRRFVLRLLTHIRNNIATLVEHFSGDREMLREAIVAAFLRGRELYSRCFSDSDPKMREDAALALGLCREAQATRELLARLVHETAPSVSKAVLVGLAQTGDSSVIPAMLNQLNSADSSVRVQAAVSICQLGMQSSPTEAIDVLIQAAQTESPEADIALYALRTLDGENLTRAYSHWIDSLPTLTEEAVGRVVSTLLFSLFPTNATRENIPAPTSLSPMQRRLLQTLVENDNVWEVSAGHPRKEITHYLSVVGLPTGRELLAQFLSRSP